MQKIMSLIRLMTESGLRFPPFFSEVDSHLIISKESTNVYIITIMRFYISTV